MKNFNSITNEKCDGSISSTWVQGIQETIKNARRKLEACVAPAMPSKIMKKNCGSDASKKWTQALRVFWKLMNLQDCVWENH